MNCNKITFLLLIFLFDVSLAYSQVAINATGNPPDSNAILDISADDKGVLIPRMDFNDRPDPAPVGLLIFVTSNGPYGNNEFYFFDGTRWKTFSPIKIGIGDKIMGGTVFWVDGTNQHGLIAAPEDQSVGAPWGCYGNLIDSLSQQIGTGEQNTAKIIAACSEEGIAARICTDLVFNNYGDWFLPSNLELCEMAKYYALVGGFTPGSYYWSSYSNSANSARAVSIDITCYDMTLNKGFLQRFRCVRKF